MAILREYDLLMPMGMNCVMATQLRKRGLRQASFPFDWLRFDDKDSCQMVSTLVTTHFKDFLAIENLILDKETQVSGRYNVVDEVQKITFIHDFLSSSLTDAVVAEVKGKYLRRIERFYQTINEANSLCFVMAANATILDLERLTQFYNAMSTYFPNLQKIDLFAVVFESDASHFEEIPMERGALYVNYVTRPQSDYDIKEKVLEFAWLDEVGLSKKFMGETAKGIVSRKMSTWERIHYKIYRHTYKWLERRGLLRTIFDV
jgi:hypothetical protein